MANQIQKFRHRDVMRVIRAVQAAGISVDQVTVDPNTGKITVGPAPGATSMKGAVDTPEGEGEPTPLEQWRAKRSGQG